MFIVTGFYFLRQIFFLNLYPLLLLLLFPKSIDIFPPCKCSLECAFEQVNVIKTKCYLTSFVGALCLRHLRDHLWIPSRGEGKESKASNMVAGDQCLLSFKLTPRYRRIFVYNICLIGISGTAR